jgi:hypothetical protein
MSNAIYSPNHVAVCKSPEGGVISTGVLFESEIELISYINNKKNLHL